MRMLRFSIFGSLYVAPTLYGWVKLSTAMWPQMTLRVGLKKVITSKKKKKSTKTKKKFIKNFRLP